MRVVLIAAGLVGSLLATSPAVAFGPTDQRGTRSKREASAVANDGSGAGASSTGAPAFDSSPSRVGRHYWYGWQTLLSDGLAFGTMLYGAKRDSTAIAGAGLGVGIAGAPIVHWAHNNQLSGGISVFMRGFTVALWTAGLSDCARSTHGDVVEGSSGFCHMVVGPVGLALILTTIGVDAGVLAYGEQAAPAAASLAPWVDPHSKTRGFLFGSSF